MGSFKTYAFDKKLDEDGMVVKPFKTTLRWPFYQRIKVYKKIALLVLADKTGYTSDTMLSFQDVVNICCAKKLNFKFKESWVENQVDHDIYPFIQLFPKDMHPAIMHYVEDQKKYNPGYSLNTFTLQAIEENLDSI